MVNTSVNTDTARPITPQSVVVSIIHLDSLIPTAHRGSAIKMPHSMKKSAPCTLSGCRTGPNVKVTNTAMPRLMNNWAIA